MVVSLDLFIAYLRAAFNTCFYCCVVTDHVEELQRKCVKHERKPLSAALVEELKAEEERVKKEWEDALSKQIQELRTGIQRAETETSTAGKTAQYVSAILRSYYACACVFFISNVHVCSMFCAHAPFTGTSRTSCRGYEVSSGLFRVHQPKRTMTEELA